MVAVTLVTSTHACHCHVTMEVSVSEPTTEVWLHTYVCVPAVSQEASVNLATMFRLTTLMMESIDLSMAAARSIVKPLYGVISCILILIVVIIQDTVS